MYPYTLFFENIQNNYSNKGKQMQSSILLIALSHLFYDFSHVKLVFSNKNNWILLSTVLIALW